MITLKTIVAKLLSALWRVSPKHAKRVHKNALGGDQPPHSIEFNDVVGRLTCRLEHMKLGQALKSALSIKGVGRSYLAPLFAFIGAMIGAGAGIFNPGTVHSGPSVFSPLLGLVLYGYLGFYLGALMSKAIKHIVDKVRSTITLGVI